MVIAHLVEVDGDGVAQLVLGSELADGLFGSVVTRAIGNTWLITSQLVWLLEHTIHIAM